MAPNGTRFQVSPKAVAALLANAMSTRSALADNLLDLHIDIDHECGYPKTQDLRPYDYKEMFEREPIAARVVCVHPNASWSELPEVYVTEDPAEHDWEKEFKALNDRVQLLTKLYRADVLSGIGSYGVLFLGFNDGLMPDQPAGVITRDAATGATVLKGSHQLLYVRPYAQWSAEISTTVDDPTSDRYGLPEYYMLYTSGKTGTTMPVAGDKGNGSAVNTKGEGIKVHWSRIIHIADNVLDDELRGAPRQRVAWNRLLDLRKTYGGSAEMFWRGAFPGYAFEVNPDIAEPEMDTTAVRQEFQDFSRTLQRYMAVQGVSVKTLAPTVSDPTAHIQVQLEAIAIALEVPLRVLMGTEEGRLAGDQDGSSWSDKVDHRRRVYVAPMLIRPTISRLVQLGALPVPPGGPEDFCVCWEEDEPNPMERVDIAAKQTDAMAKYVQGNVDALLPPADWFTQVLGWDEDQVKVVEATQLEAMRQEEADANAAALAAAQQKQQQGPPGGPGKPPAPGANPAAKGPPQPPKAAK